MHNAGLYAQVSQKKRKKKRFLVFEFRSCRTKKVLL